MTFEQRNAIAHPDEWLLVVCTHCRTDGGTTVSIFLNGSWQNLTGMVRAICQSGACTIKLIHLNKILILPGASL